MSWIALIMLVHIDASRDSTLYRHDEDIHCKKFQVEEVAVILVLPIVSDWYIRLCVSRIVVNFVHQVIISIMLKFNCRNHD